MLSSTAIVRLTLITDEIAPGARLPMFGEVTQVVPESVENSRPVVSSGNDAELRVTATPLAVNVELLFFTLKSIVLLAPCDMFPKSKWCGRISASLVPCQNRSRSRFCPAVMDPYM